jgi:hypothetical protein
MGLKEIFSLKKKEPEFAEGGEVAPIVIGGIPYRVKGRVGRDVVLSQVRAGVGGRPLGGLAGIQSGVMSEIQRRNVAVFGGLGGRAVTGAFKAPFEAAEFVGEKGMERFQAQRKAAKAREAFRHSPKFLEKQDFQKSTKQKLERIGLGHITFEDYNKSREAFDRQIRTHLPKQPVVQEQRVEQAPVLPTETKKPEMDMGVGAFDVNPIKDPFTAKRN